MKVKDLIAILDKLPDNTEIIIQKDPEGNGYSPLTEANVDGVYLSDNQWSGEVYDTKWSASEACMSQQEWDKVKRKRRCLTLVPIC